MSKKLSLFLIIAILLTTVLPVSIPSVQAVVANTITKEGDKITYDFEDGKTQGWSQAGSIAVAATNEAFNSGAYSLKASGATQFWEGAALDITSFPAGQYKIEAHLKYASTETVSLKVTNQNTDTTNNTSYPQIGSNISPSSWTKFEATFDKTKLMTASSIKIEASDGATNTPDYYLDDVTITLEKLDTSVVPPKSAIKSYEYNFDDGTAQSWSPRGSSVKVDISTEAAISAPNSIKVTGRTDSWNGASLNVLNKLEKNTVYTMTAKVRVVSVITPAAISLTMQYTPSTGSQNWKGIASTEVINDTNWHDISGTYTFSEDMTEQLLYFESADANTAFYIDDIEITPPGAGLKNIDFEDAVAHGFSSKQNEAKISATNNDKKNGSWSLLTSDRKQAIDGPILDVTDKVAYGNKYNISAWLKIASDTTTQASIVLSAEITNNEGKTNYANIETITVTSDEWVNLTYDYIVPEAKKIRLYFETKEGTLPFYLDDFSITGVTSKGVQKDIPSLKDVFSSDFDFGAAITPGEEVGNSGDLLAKHFNSYVAGNDTKPDAILGSSFMKEIKPENLNWTTADKIKDYTETNKMSWRWHTFVWHNQVPDWLFTDENGNELTTVDSSGNIVLIETDPKKQEANKELVLNRLRAYIKCVIEKYGEYIDSYDVVNEVIDPSQPDGFRRSKWFVITGKDYIKVAFETAREELDKNNYKGKLYINDYNTEQPSKRDFIYKLVQELNLSKKLVDGVGHQCHVGRTQPSVKAITDSIKKFGDAGLENQITELDMSNYDDQSSDFKTAVPDSVLLEQGHRYKKLFEGILALNNTKSTAPSTKYVNSVTVWGISDANTWLSTQPIKRLEKPLLFDEDLQAKYAYWGVVLANPDKASYASNLPILIKNLVTPKGSPVIDGKSELLWDANAATELQSNSGFAGAFKVRWDANNLYVFAEITDPSGEDCSVDVYTKVSKTTLKCGENSDNCKVVKTSQGYTFEAKIPLASAVALKDSVPFDIRFNSSKGEMLSWNDTTNSQDITLDKIGILTLSDSVNTTEAIKGTPVIDGKMDDRWISANEINANNFINATTGAIAKVKTMWDDKNFYVYAVVTDNNLHKEATKGNEYQQDSVEIFIDQLNNRTDTYGDDDGQYRINFDNELSLGSNPGASMVTTAAIKTADGSGYIVEAAIALDKIKPTEGTILGFDLQVNSDDNGDGKRDSIAIWNDLSGNGWSTLAKLGAVKLVKDSVTKTETQVVITIPIVYTIVKWLTINGTHHDYAKAAISIEKGIKIIAIVFNEDKIDDMLKDNNGKVSIVVNEKSNVVTGELSGKCIREMYKKKAVIEIKTQNVSCQIPTAQLNLEKLAPKLGSNVNLNDVKVNIKIEESSEVKVKIVESTAKKHKCQVIGKPIDFKVSCTSGSNTIEISKFDKYVERTIAIPEGYNIKNKITGVAIAADGSFCPVPTTIVEVDGKYYAKIKCLSNSTYSLVSNDKSYKDVEKHWSKAAVDDIASRFIMDGIDSENFMPNANVTRGEFIDAIVKSMGAYESGQDVDAFNDVPKISKYYDSISIAYEYGIVSGYKGNKFNPTNKITRQEAITILAKSMKVFVVEVNVKIKVEYTASEADSILSGFKDSQKVSGWAKSAMAACAEANIISGTNTNLLAPNTDITRGEVASIIKKLLEKSELI